MCTYTHRTIEAEDCPLCGADSTYQLTKEGLENLTALLGMEPNLSRQEVKEAMAGYQ